MGILKLSTGDYDLKNKVFEVGMTFTNSALHNPLKSILTFNAELIKVVVSNLHPSITNMVNIMVSALKVRNKDLDKIMGAFGKRFQCLGVCWVAESWYIFIIDGDKVLNMLTVVVDWSLPNWISTLRFNYIGENLLQSFPVLFVYESHIVLNVNNWTKLGKSVCPMKYITQNSA